MNEAKERLFCCIEKSANEAKNFLKKLIAIPSVAGEEKKALEYVKKKFFGLGRVRYVPIPAGIKRDPEYSFHAKDLNYNGRSNLLLESGSRSGKKSLVLSAHIDTVEGGRDFPRAFKPEEKSGSISGRGACDAKGQIAVVYLLLRALKECGLKLKGLLRVHIVIEEEVGGNGALSFIRQGYLGSGAVVLEPSSLNMYSANRGALWFRINIKGKPLHMGRKFEGVNAIDKGMIIIKHLYGYEKRLIKESRNYPLFERYRHPVQLNIGMFHSGILPSMVAGEAVIEGGVGFLPNKNIAKIKKEIKEVIDNIDDPWIRKNYSLEFKRLHNEAYFTHPGNIFVEKFRDSLSDAGIDRSAEGWNVSCDARLYARVGRMPTIVFGAGDIARAHSREESVKIKDIVKASKGIASFAVDWLGTDKGKKQC